MSATSESPTQDRSARVPAAPTEAAGRQFVTFRIRSEFFGVPLADVREIIRMPELVQVPLCPPSLEGIANLRGTVLPITSLRHVFGIEAAAHDDATRVMVISQAGITSGLVVDRMDSVITADRQEIESGGAMDSALRSDLLHGVIKRPDRMIMLLDPGRLTGMRFSAEPKAQVAQRGRGAEANHPMVAGLAKADELQLVSFEVAQHEYAFPISDVQEIVQIPGHITEVPKSSPDVVGVMILRDRLLPLVSLRRMFALPESAMDEHGRIVVVALGSGSVGIIMDTVKEVLRVSRALIDPVPPLLADAADGSQLDAICRLAGGKRLVTILSADRLFRDTALRAAIASASTGQTNDMARDQLMTETSTATTHAIETDDEEQFVIFRLAGEEYGVPIESVQEIVRKPDNLTQVPKAAGFIEGVVNLRGAVLPVIDQRRRFALEEAERNDRQRIMVLTIGGLRTGFIVDQVTEVLKIARRSIVSAPALSAGQARLIDRVANLAERKRMILLLDPANLLDPGELGNLREL